MAILKRQRVMHIQHTQPDDGQVRNAADLLEYAKTIKAAQFPLDTRFLIKSLDIGLRLHPMPPQKSGFLKLEEGRWVIGVNSVHHPKRQQFTMAHELGHYFLHRETIGEIDDSILFRADGFGEPGPEREANLFAAELLMPDEEFLGSIRKFNGNVDDISNYFGVSSLAVRIRADSLGFKEKKN